MDSVSFLYIWGSFFTWAVITVICLLTALLSYAKLPLEIPVQWSDGAASALVDRRFIFAYPAACIVIRYFIRPLIYGKLQMKAFHSKVMTEYLTNYICFAALSVEIFTVLFVYGRVKNVVIVLAVDTAVLIGVLLRGFTKNKPLL